ncbi:DUF5343 domain-containing protein [Loktanella sp. Alg231-35]|uniref:DUF5343 domain-containing protein n=1 Tax=Loktanella sp. Alg231-35 TaxID=1922220 RepID=UPI00131EE347|nr:DUF5343 domain-containing protein [Loktanella sp. Alg231-35]
MSSYPQIYVVEKYQEFLKTLGGVGRPSSVDLAYIKKLGYKSSYELNFLAAIKFIGLVEAKRGGGPTELWGKLRTDMGKALADGLTQGYADVFDFYPDAHLRDEEALANFFRGNSDADAESISRMVNAFIAVRDLSKFEDQSDEQNFTDEAQADKASDKTKGDLETKSKPPIPALPGRSAVNLNIQLQLPSDASGEVYDKFFAAMKKHGLI